MPKVKRDGREYRIPFDPRILAGLIFEGHEVFPDEGVSPDQIKEENSLIQGELSLLWGDQDFRTGPGRFDAPGKTVIPDTFDAGKPFQAYQDKLHDFRKVVPNPDIQYRIPILQNNPPDLLETKIHPAIEGQTSAPKMQAVNDSGRYLDFLRRLLRARA